MASMVGDKAEAFAEEASALGWKVEITRNKDKATVEATLDGKQISISWRGNACLNEVYFGSDGHSRKLRNAGAARRKLAEEAGEPPRAASESGSDLPVKPTKAKPKKAAKAKPEPFKSKPKPRTSLPFDPDSATDEEILEAVRGKKIVWKNRMSGGYDEARVMVMPNQRHLKIDLNRQNERCITFAEADDKRPNIPGGGFRSVRVKSMVSVTK